MFLWSKITSEERIPQSKGFAAAKYRSEIESDYHRIIRSASFRRLQDKTQVFPLDKSDFVRTRLTHSLEVSSIAKLIGKQVCSLIMEKNIAPKDNQPDSLKVIEILNCAGLLHDIGNPPFGHFGESAIRNWFKYNLVSRTYKDRKVADWLSDQQIADLLNYEGNAQALRIITKLHRLTGKSGMHLTCGVMDSIIKYPVSSLEKIEEDKKNKKERNLLKKKIGYFQSEEEQFMKIKEQTGTLGCRNPLCFILEAADDLAYTFADLEDGYKKGLYSYEQLLDTVEEAEDAVGASLLKQGLKEGKSLAESSEKGFDPYQYAVFTWLTKKQLFSISRVSEAFIDYYEEIMNGTFKQELIAVSSEGLLISRLKKFAYDHVYNEAANLRMELMGNEIITFLMDRFLSALLVYDSDEDISEIEQKYIDLLSGNYLSAYQNMSKGKAEGERLYLRLLLGADYIAGMTDSYAKSLYQELKGI